MRRPADWDVCPTQVVTSSNWTEAYLFIGEKLESMRKGWTRIQMIRN